MKIRFVSGGDLPPILALHGSKRLAQRPEAVASLIQGIHQDEFLLGYSRIQLRCSRSSSSSSGRKTTEVATKRLRRETQQPSRRSLGRRTWDPGA